MKKNFLKKFISSILTIVTLSWNLSFQAQAQTEMTNKNLDFAANGSQPATEYYWREYPSQILYPIKLLGAVKRPGIYHLPIKTSLTTALSLAGGAETNSDIDEILITRDNAEKKIIKLNYDNFITSGDVNGPILEKNDLIQVKGTSPWISRNAMTAITVLSSTLGIILSAIIIRKETK